MDYLDFVEPTNIFNYKFNENSVKNIKMVLKKFKHIGDDNLAFSEILKIQHYFSSEDNKMWEQKSVVSFWTDLEETKNFNGTLLFLSKERRATCAYTTRYPCDSTPTGGKEG